MKIRWFGHACFAIYTNGKTIITDPFNHEVGYPLPNLPADFATISHQHFDHNALGVVPGNPVAVQKEGRQIYENIEFIGVSSFHDKFSGEQRGSNIIFIIEAEGMRICHLGDLGHILDQEQIKKIGRVDILFVPVGGYYTIGPDEALQVTTLLKPKYLIPMHYKTDYIDFPISTADDFLKHCRNYLVKQELSVTTDSLPAEMQVVLLEIRQVQ